MCTSPESLRPMSTNAPKSTTFKTVPLSSMPAVKSSIFKIPFLKIGLGRSSRGSRSGRPSASMMSRSVNSPTSSSRDSSPRSACGQLFVELGQPVLVAHNVGSKPELLEQLDRDRVALGMNPGSVERMLAVGDLEKSRRLRERRRTDPLDLRQLVAAGERAVLLAVVDDPPGGQLVEARDVPEQGHARRVEVDADKVDATGDDRLERLLELLGIDVVLVKPDADILGLDLDELGQRILEPAADRDAAPQGGVEVGKLVAADLACRVNAGPGLVDDDVGELREQRIGRMGPRRLWRRRRAMPWLGDDRDRDESDLPWPPCLGGARTAAAEGRFAGRPFGGLAGAAGSAAGPPPIPMRLGSGGRRSALAGAGFRRPPRPQRRRSRSVDRVPYSRRLPSVPVGTTPRDAGSPVLAIACPRSNTAVRTGSSFAARRSPGNIDFRLGRVASGDPPEIGGSTSSGPRPCRVVRLGRG